ncbi:hypothetical protein T484DRAFT_1837484, partial [Baffinella frigidus]
MRRRSRQGVLALLAIAVLCGGADGARFTKATIYQSTPFPDAMNTLTVHLKIDTAVSDSTAISISGLAGAMVTGDSVMLSGPSASLFQDAEGACSTAGTAGQAKWTNSSGNTLVMWPVGTIAANTDLRVSFLVRNARGQQGPQGVTIKATGAAMVDPRDMWSSIVLGSMGVVTTDAANCAPQVDGSESSVTPIGAGRGIDALTVEVLNGSTVPGSDTLDSGIVVNSSFAALGEGCSQGTLRADGVLSVSVVTPGCGCDDYTMVAGTVYKLVANAPSLGADGDGRFFARANFIFTCSKDSATFTSMASCRAACVSQGGTCSGSVSPNVTIEEPGWGYATAPTLSWYPALPSTSDACTATFAATVSSGKGFSADFSRSGGVTTISSLSRGFGYSASTDRLVFVKTTTTPCKFPAGTKFPGGEVPLDLDARKISSVSVTVADPLGDGARTNVFNEAPLVDITKWTGTSSGCNTSLFVPEMEEGRYMGAAGDEWSEAGDAAPLKILEAGFVLARIRQSSARPGGVNTLTVSLVASVAMRATTNITITGLDLAAVSNGAVDVASSTGDTFTGEWRCPGTIVLVTAAEIPAGQLTTFSWTISNNKPTATQAAPTNIFVSMDAPVAGEAPPARSMYRGDPLASDGVASSMTQPLYVVAPVAFETTAVWQTLAYPFYTDGAVTNIADGTKEGTNTLSFRIKFTADFPVTSFLEISGLAGIASQSAELALTGASAANLMSAFCSKPTDDQAGDPCSLTKQSTGLWDLGAKKLTLFMYRKVTAGTTLSFSIVTPLTYVVAPDIKVGARSVATSTSRWNAMLPSVDIAPVKMDTGMPMDLYCPTGIDNQAPDETQPFFFRTPSFVIKKVKQDTSFLSTPNFLTFTFASNVPLQIGVVVTFT